MSQTKEIPHTVREYVVLPVTLPPSKALPKALRETPAHHYIYIRRHEPKIPTHDDSRTLFLTNIPITSTQEHFQALFSKLCPGAKVVETEFLAPIPTPRNEKLPYVAELAAGLTNAAGKKRKRTALESKGTDDEFGFPNLRDTWDRKLARSGSSSLVVFADETTCDAVFRAVKRSSRKGTAISWGEGVKGLPKLGLQRYETHHHLRYPGQAELQSHADEYVHAFTTAEALATTMAAQSQNEPDEDGFTMVTSARPRAVIPTAPTAAQLKEKSEKEKRKHEPVTDFYRFQLREEKKKRQNDMLRRFENDKRRVEEMKKRRKSAFRPE